MIIETPRLADWDAILRVAKNTEVFLPEELDVVQEMFNGLFHPNSYNDHSFYVCRKDDTQALVGFVVFGPIPMADRVWDLYWICVERAEQGAGIGAMLFKRLEEDVRAQGGRAVYLETSDAESYRPARKFYERHGFECVAHLPDYYAIGESMLMYRKKLA